MNFEMIIDVDVYGNVRAQNPELSKLELNLLEKAGTYKHKEKMEVFLLNNYHHLHKVSF